jgi:hypothetical protein
VCGHCQETLPRDVFYREPRKGDGLSDACIPCKREANRVAARRRRANLKAAAA